ncbi:tRNA (adenosine(37)-N6)-threonylcarbamoyltransferase complex dimerization subunit type 1 TsaB [Aquimarina sp. SS2-1]|uniref:tRNA (adenosine(37)-N6)-threonylcarbamoyltransferase complex dimerization subunit type 1 TsaB n=1 Tax=Aquimarina besae TaxID=3342247 RepID=UPI00366E1DBC
MTYILCIETSTTNCSVAIVGDGKVVMSKEDYDTKYSHAERLHHFIEQVISESGLSFTDLDAIAVSKGPGSYTGLRIGVSAAKGLSYGLGIPLISVSTLLSLALQVKSKEGVIIPMIDARRMEVYSAVFSNEYDQLRPIEAEVLTETSYQDYLRENKVYFIGNGVTKFTEICNHQNAEFILKKLPSANEMATIAYKKFLSNKFEDVSYFEPYYLKDFVTG